MDIFLRAFPYQWLGVWIFRDLASFVKPHVLPAHRSDILALRQLSKKRNQFFQLLIIRISEKRANENRLVGLIQHLVRQILLRENFR